MPPASSSSATTTSVQVALRIRPPTAQDSTSIPVRFQRSVIQATSSTSVTVESPSNALAGAGAPGGPSSGGSVPKKQPFTFDQVHPPPTTQFELFESTAKPMVARFLDGFNCTILAYGQTSSGKTFTMTGVDLEADPSDPNNGMGIIPRAVSTIFSRAKQLKTERGVAWNYSIKGSFVELYNEDLIDLLSIDDTTGGRREVQIREDKDGHIIWGGLREVNVRNAPEVMSLIRKGAAVRRTNETDMNAQSSRSHAIFSLTLIQKKFTGSSIPPRSSSPLPSAGRSPSRLARPGSMYAGPSSNRVASPVFGRPATPGIATAMGRGGGLRPASALGHAGERSLHGDEDSGEWVTITSKFHFVDLAGSERLKRTAAVGERIKEGISINSGLLALGNVISALGDPSRAKSHTATHVPYRDSKLTRLLQDSLGGNAHTLMIACVSPAEWNAGETINTLKYANRARNIKNRAVVNEKEDGWDDIEWLQSTVSRLRKELKAIKEGKISIESDKEPEAIEGAGKRVLAQLTELQNNYEGLREKFVERTEELTRLRRELGEKHRSSSSGAISGTAKYEEIVGPVIEEYEKAITTMEAELSLNRAALRHTNEMVEEKEEELGALTNRHAATELYVEELRARIAKLTEREASTEAYVHDLEEKIKAYDESSISSNESMIDLKRELSRFKESEAYSTKYIADLEARLSKSDESILTLQQNVERLEQECERRRAEADALQYKMDTLQRDGEGWRADLEEREKRVLELEQKMAEWELKKQEAGEARARLGNVVEEVVSAKKSFEDLSSTSTSPRTTPNDLSVVADAQDKGITDVPHKASDVVEAQYLALQQTHTATLADLSTITAKYRDALREISDLASQLQEAKLGNPTIAEDGSIDSPATEPPDLPQFKRRMTGGRHRDAHGEPQYNAAGRRLFFRQAASAESLHSRSQSQSVSLSQELSSAHLRKASFSSHGTGSSHSPSSSHSQLALHTSNSRPNLSIAPPTNAVNGHERTISSLEKEIMRLQEVLKDRETEILTLEESLRESAASHQTQEKELATPPPETRDTASPNINLSPKTLNHFDHIKQSMVNGNGHAITSENGSTHSESDESLERLNELMLSMAQKESQHREIVEDLNAQLVQTKRQLDELTALSRNQALNMSNELEALQNKYIHSLDELKDHQTLFKEATERKAELEVLLQQTEAAHTAEIEQLRQQHEMGIKAKEAEIEVLLGRMREEEESALEALSSELREATTSLQQARSDHEEVFGKLNAEHDTKLRRQTEEAREALASMRAEHQKAINKLLTDHAEALHQKDIEASAASQTTEEEYYNALTKLRVDQAEAITKLTAESNATIERLREEHAGELRMMEIARQGSLSESESSRNLAVKELQDEHAAALARKEASFAEEIEGLKAAYARTLQAQADDHGLQKDRLRLEFESLSLKMKEDWRKEVDALTSALAEEKDKATSALSKAAKDSDAALQSIREQHAVILQELERGYLEDTASLKASHALALEAAYAQTESESQALSKEHREAWTRLTAEHEQKLATISAELETTRSQHHATESAHEESQQVLIEQTKIIEDLKRARLEEQDKLRDLLDREHAEERDKQFSDLKRQHHEDKQTLQRDYELLVQELEAHKAAAEEFTMLREQTRVKHETVIAEKSNAIHDAQSQLTLVNTERDGLAAQVVKLQEELKQTRSEQSKLVQEASKRESLVVELERHRSLIAELQENLHKVKDEKDVLQLEKQRQDTLVRDLQAQIARSASPPNVRSPERPVGYPRVSGLPPAKPPPPTPPPSIPPPPAPRLVNHINGESSLSTSSQGSSSLTFSTSKDSQPDSPSTSLGHPSVNGHPPLDPKLASKIEQQAKLLEEQEAMIKTLNKQLTHCESDLQAHMELVNTLETSLGDSEKNLRKARMQATELARERDSLSSRTDALQNELNEAKHEVVTVRRSIVEEKQSLEQRLDEERRAKERVRQQLDLRMEELQKRKSKFACL